MLKKIKDQVSSEVNPTFLFVELGLDDMVGGLAALHHKCGGHHLHLSVLELAGHLGYVVLGGVVCDDRFWGSKSWRVSIGKSWWKLTS